MACQHSNPIGYLFCSTCGQFLEHQRCLCGFVCGVDAFYCGRCGHSLKLNETAGCDTLSSVSGLEQRYDLDLLVQIAGIHDKKLQPNLERRVIFESKKS